jgi:hypothetical protein
VTRRPPWRLEDVLDNPWVWMGVFAGGLARHIPGMPSWISFVIAVTTILYGIAVISNAARMLFRHVQDRGHFRTRVWWARDAEKRLLMQKSQHEGLRRDANAALRGLLLYEVNTFTEEE